MLFQKKYRIESARLKEWDYSNSAWYYVTICTKNMQNFFGTVSAEKIELSLAGNIVEEEWRRTIEIRKNVELDEYVIMPNHLHGIIIINNTNTVETTGSVVSDEQFESKTSSKTAHRAVSTENDKKRLKPNSLSSIIGQFKSVTAKRIRKEVLKDFSWQSRFYDHIIRNEKSLEAIRKYIMLNPLKWEIDVYYKK